METHAILAAGASVLLLTACAPRVPSPHGQTGGGHTPSQVGSINLVVRDQSTNVETIFSVQENGKPFTDFGISHTKEMHLIVVRDDLQHFQHLHPERDAAGVWRIPFTAPAGGDYWLYADFVDTKERPYTIRFENTYPGDLGMRGIVKNFERVKTVDGYRFAMEPQTSSDEVTFTYTITDRQGLPVKLEQYLGATGHSILLSPSGDFIHTHPSEEVDAPVFATSTPSDDFYRVFTQFQIEGRVFTVSFDWQRV